MIMKAWSEQTLSEKIKNLKNIVEHDLPQAKRMISEVKNKRGVKCIILHQDAFAADYQLDEFTLLGMFVKYVGLIGSQDILIIGKNRSTLKAKKSK